MIKEVNDTKQSFDLSNHLVTMSIYMGDIYAFKRGLRK